MDLSGVGLPSLSTGLQWWSSCQWAMPGKDPSGPEGAPFSFLWASAFSVGIGWALGLLQTLKPWFWEEREAGHRYNSRSPFLECSGGLGHTQLTLTSAQKPSYPTFLSPRIFPGASGSRGHPSPPLSCSQNLETSPPQPPRPLFLFPKQATRQHQGCQPLEFSEGSTGLRFSCSGFLLSAWGLRSWAASPSLWVTCH